MKSTKLTKVQKKALQDQVITHDRPGPVLHDFRSVLEFLGPEGVEAGGKYHLLPIRIIEELDEQLSHPLHLALKRPQIRSHSYIQGLNLLLRASGLAQVRRSGAKARLVLDPALIEQWDHLNPTEQYFQLLEAWLRIGRAEMVGERGSFGAGDLLGTCMRARNLIPADGYRLDLGKSSRTYVPGFYGNLYILALMDLFGLFKVEQPRQPITPWLPARVERTPFGDAVLTLLNDSILEILFGEDDGPANQPHFGAWQSLFQPYFPEWKRNLELPKAEARAGVFIFRASLGKIWRRFAMPAESTLGDLFTMIRRSVEFDDDHLYEFRYIDQFGAEVTAGHPRMDEGPWADDIAVGSLPLAPGQEMQLTYDFGDNWQFKVKLERIETNDPTVKEPTLLESHGEAPEQYPSWDD